MLRDSSPNLSPGVFTGLAAGLSGLEGLSLKVSIVDLQPEHELWGFEVQDVLWMSFNL